MLIERFFKVFPPPQFLAMPRVGLDIADEAIRFIEFVRGKDGLEIGRYGEKKLPAGVVEAGYINEMKALTEALVSLKKEHHLSFVKASLPEEKVYLFKAEVPTGTMAEMRANIEFRLEENVPVAPQDAIFSYEIIQSDTVKAGMTHLGVSVLPQKVVKTYLEVFEAAGLFVLDFETEGRAIKRALVNPGDKGTYMLINFTERRTGVFIVSEGAVLFTSTLAIGGELLTNAVAKHFSLSDEEAQKYKEAQGRENKDSKDVFDYSLNTLSALKDEVGKILLYWNTHEDLRVAGAGLNKKIEKIILSGKNSGLVGLDTYLAVSLKTPVAQADVWKNAFDYNNYIPPIECVDALNFAVPIGLGLPKQSHV
jgi:type IV pilus assembly protein PilM